MGKKNSNWQAVLCASCFFPLFSSISARAEDLQVFLPSPSSVVCSSNQNPYFELANVAETLCPTVSFHGQPPHLAGKLSPYWAQELIGADLAKTFVAAQNEIKEVRVAVQDQTINFDLLPQSRMEPGVAARFSVEQKAIMLSSHTHATAVINLILGDGPFGVSESSRIVAFHKVDADPDGRSRLPIDNRLLAIESYAQTRPQLLNISTSVGNETDDSRAFARLSQKTILVAATGNDSTPLEPALKNFPGILVGNLSPVGVTERGSRSGPEVTIVAPSSTFLLSKFNDDPSKQSEGGSNIRPFGGTSGAAPLVTGALANGISIIGDMTLAEAKRILCGSAIPILSTSESSVDGCGMVNAYKLVRVAKRLKDLGWPANRDSLLKNPQSFDFSAEAHSLLAKAKKQFQSRKCEDRKLAFEMLRQSYLLDPRPESAELLAKVLESQGLDLNAAFYRMQGPKRSEVLMSLLTSAKSNRRGLEWLFTALPKLSREVPAFSLSPKDKERLDKFVENTFANLLNETKLDDYAQYGMIESYIKSFSGPKLGPRLVELVTDKPSLLTHFQFAIIESGSPESGAICKLLLNGGDKAYTLRTIISANRPSDSCLQEAGKALGSLSENDWKIISELRQYLPKKVDSFFDRFSKFRSRLIESTSEE